MGDRARGAGRQRRDRAGRQSRRLHADPGGVARDPARQQGEVEGAGRRHRGDAVAQPAVGRRLQVQPAARRTGRHRRDRGDRGPRQRADQGRARRRTPDAVREGARGRELLRLHGHLRRRPARGRRPRGDQGGRRADRRRPAGWGVRGLLGRDRQPPRPRPDRGQPPGRRDVAVHDPRLGRQDPDGLLVAVGDGLARRPEGQVPDRHRQRRRRRPARHRDPGRRADEPQPLPGGRDPVPLRRLPGRAGRPPRRSARPWCRAR